MIELLLLHMQAQLVKLRDDERGDVLTTIALILGFFLLAGIVVAVITAAVNSRTAQIN